VEAYFLQSVPYNNAPTHVFAYVGIPSIATKDNPVPGVVLIHGGGGTAFYDWVKMWNDWGYAAIAIDTELTGRETRILPLTLLKHVQILL
jgi:hypothetical protein